MLLLTGGIVAAAPALLQTMIALATPRRTFESGWTTLLDHLAYLPTKLIYAVAPVGFYFGLGALGGFAFWVVVADLSEDALIN